MYIQEIIKNSILDALESIFQIKHNTIELQQTKKEFEGDITFVVFPLVKELKLSPREIAEKIGEYLVVNSSVVSFNIVSALSSSFSISVNNLATDLISPFLSLSIISFWLNLQILLCNQ